LKRYILLRLLFIPFFLLSISFSFLSCDEDSTSLDVQAILDDLFPLVTGRTIIYGEGTLLRNDTQEPISGTENGFTSQWEVGSNITLPYLPYTNPVVILDITSVPAAGISNSPRQFFIHKDTTNGNFDFLTNLGYLFRSQKIYNTPGDSTSGIESDSLIWIGLSKSTEGVGKEWVAYTANYTSATLGVIKFEIVGMFERETLTLSGTNYDTYKLTATRKIYLGNSTTAVSIGTTAILWLAPNIGPVKIILIGDGESHGKSQTMTSRNF